MRRVVRYGRRGRIENKDKDVTFHGTVMYFNKINGNPTIISSVGAIYYEMDGIDTKTIYPNGRDSLMECSPRVFLNSVYLNP